MAVSPGDPRVISTQPKSDPSGCDSIPEKLANPGSGPVVIRNMKNTAEESEIAARLAVEAFRDKFVHATSESSIEKLIRGITLDFQVQNPDFFERMFIAEVGGEIAGVLSLEFHGDPKPANVDEHFDSLGCCDKCGLACLSIATDYEDVRLGRCYLSFICVDDKYRGKGVGKALMERANLEARKRGCNVIYLWVHSANRAIHLYERLGYVKKQRKTYCCCGIWCMLGVKAILRMDKDL